MSQTRGEAENPFGYATAIWERFRAPRRAGAFDASTEDVITGQAGSPSTQSVLRLQFRLAEGRVVDARFKAYGCPTSIAVGGWIAEWSIGRNLAELQGLKVAQLRAALEISDERAHCAVLGEDAIRAAIAQPSP